MTVTTTRKALAWGHGCLAVQSLGGMLGPVAFILPDGRMVSPLHVAPWGNDPQRASLPVVLRELRGEWPCVPFGADAGRSLASGWSAAAEAFDGADLPHGYGSNSHWEWSTCDDHEICLVCKYPEDHAIRMLRRRIVPDPQNPAVDITLDIEVRRDCRLPIGLHPTFRLPSRQGCVRIEPSAYDRVFSFPGAVEPGAGLFAPDRIWESLKYVQSASETLIDATRVPMAETGEDLLQLAGCDGHVTLHYLSEGFSAALSWQKEHFPSLLLWFSLRGRSAYPWSGRHLALGVEPVASAFDLGPSVSTADNPLSRSGVSTSISFTAGETFSTKYRISVGV